MRKEFDNGKKTWSETTLKNDEYFYIIIHIVGERTVSIYQYIYNVNTCNYLKYSYWHVHYVINDSSAHVYICVSVLGTCSICITDKIILVHVYRSRAPSNLIKYNIHIGILYLYNFSQTHNISLSGRYCTVV